MKNNNIFKKLKGLPIQYKTLYISLIMSIVGILISCTCFVSFTYAWFTTSEITKTNNIDAGIIAIEIYKESDGAQQITEDSPLFNENEPFKLGEEIIKTIYVENRGTLDAEYALGITVKGDDSLEEENSISELVDVFIAKYDFELGEFGDYIYLGSLDYMNKNHNYDTDNCIYVRGYLDCLYRDYEEDEEIMYEDMYNLKFVIADQITKEYEDNDIEINIELISQKKVDDICTITGLSNNDDYGLVLGGGTYYIDDNHEIDLIPLAKKGYKFDKWEDNDSIDNPRRITTNSNQKYKAIFIVDETSEEGTDDPFAD